MKTLHISVVDKIATYQQRDGEVVCGNSDYVIEFAFDSEWDDYTEKTARFVVGNYYEDVIFADTTCPVPMVTNTSVMSVGVYAGNLSTTTPASIKCKKSILCGNATEGSSTIAPGTGNTGGGLPAVTEYDNGKTMVVVDGKWAAIENDVLSEEELAQLNSKIQ